MVLVPSGRIYKTNAERDGGVVTCRRVPNPQLACPVHGLGSARSLNFWPPSYVNFLPAIIHHTNTHRRHEAEARKSRLELLSDCLYILH